MRRSIESTQCCCKRRQTHGADRRGGPRTNRVYQVTVSLDHNMSLDAMDSLARGLGYIRDNEEIAPEQEVERLEFYWVVPIGIASKWKNRAPPKYVARSNDTQDIVDKKELLNKVLAMHLDQYVLPMTYESPIPYRERNERPIW